MHAKIKQIEKDRNEKLRQFRQEVSERVRKVKRFEHKKELNKSLEKVCFLDMCILLKTRYLPKSPNQIAHQ